MEVSLLQGKTGNVITYLYRYRSTRPHPQPIHFLADTFLPSQISFQFSLLYLIFLAIQTNMDSIPHNKTNTTHPEKHHHQQSTSELLSSAKLLAEAATATLHHESDKVDKGRVSGAAADLLDAASHYCKLEEKSYVQYIEKAENYLRQHASHSTTTTHGHYAATPATTHSSSHSGGDGNSEGGYGDYFKMAQV
ncbi:hypothetical protein F0562_031904 [Nyssa sinensis]|uniref:Uncharacterized protein n=1 Tax=Nyssa sinensis TaxID=561372 RepID=A0A5J5AY63_9ASTE|nr:hypothetical protein F0562_031904 [Nyssa sinensis]